MRVVVALGGNALLRRGEPQGVAQQRAHVEQAAAQLALIAGHELLVTHGNGPQVGLLALQAAAYSAVPAYPLDVLGAESEGMIGYLLEQALNNQLPERVVATLLTRTEVSLADPAFQRPNKPIGPVYAPAEAARLALEHGWTMAADGEKLRRVVASPVPLRVLSLPAIRWLLAQGALVIAGGGGGVPVAAAGGGRMQGVEAVIDKDASSGLLAQDLAADCFVIATDMAAVQLDWGLPTQRPLGRVKVDALLGMSFASGSMAPKVAAACVFCRATGRRTAIGSLDDIEGLLAGSAGTQIEP